MALRSPVNLYQDRGSVIVNQPTHEPVTLEEMREHLRIDDEDEHVYLIDCISEAREAIEEWTGLALLFQRWKLTIDRWPIGAERWWDGVQQGSAIMLYGPNSSQSLKLPKFPVIGVHSVTTYDENSNATTINVSNVFDIDTSQKPARMKVKFGETWPTALRALNAIEVQYNAGYGTTANTVPRPIRRAIKLLAAYYFSNRGDGCSVGNAMQISGADQIMQKYQSLKV